MNVTGCWWPTAVRIPADDCCDWHLHFGCDPTVSTTRAEPRCPPPPCVSCDLLRSPPLPGLCSNDGLFAGRCLQRAVGESWKLSVTWPPLSSSPLKIPGSSQRSTDDLPTAAHFLPIKTSQREKRRTQTRCSYPHEYLAESPPPATTRHPHLRRHHCRHPPLSLCWQLVWFL